MLRYEHTQQLTRDHANQLMHEAAIERLASTLPVSPPPDRRHYVRLRRRYEFHRGPLALRG